MSDAKTEAGEGRAKRQRKQPEAFKPEVKVQQEFVIKAGRGTKLSDIPNVKFKLSKHKADEDVVVDLHRALYQRTGTAIKRKRDILEFSGFVWEGDEEKEKAKALERLNKFKLDVLTQMCDIFEVPKDGKKEDKAARIVEYLLTPKANSDKDLAALEAKKKEAKKRQREKTKSKTTATKSKGKKKSKKESSDDDDEEEEEEEEEEQEEEEAEEEEEEDGEGAEEETKKESKKGGKKEGKEEVKKGGKSGKKADKKVAEAKEEGKEEEEEQGDEEEAGAGTTKDGEAEQGAGKADKQEGKEEQEEEEEPKSKKAKQAPKAKGKGAKGAAKDAEATKAEDDSSASPTDDELKEAVCSVVSGVDAASYSFKNLMVDLEAKFPNAKFSSARKKLIKAWLVELITPPEAEAAAEEKPEAAADEKTDA